MKKSIIKIFTLLCAVVFCSSSQAYSLQDGFWDYLDATASLRKEGCVDVAESDNASYCVYPATIVSKTKRSYLEKKEDVYKEFWAETVFYPVKDDIYRTKQYYIVDCTNRLYARSDYIDYGNYDGTKVIESSSGNDYRPNRHIPPNTVIEGVFDFVCKYSLNSSK